MRTTMHAVILAAGLGRRLGADRPKPLVEVAPGVTLLGRLLDALAPMAPIDRTLLVVGYEADTVHTAAAGACRVDNPRFRDTNTAASLRLALDALPDAAGDTLWVNADLVADPADVRRFAAATDAGSRALVRPGAVGPEDVAYRANRTGEIERIGKGVRPASGEAVGLHVVSEADRPALARALCAADDSAYFERAMQACIDAGAVRFRAIPAAGFCREVDTPADLAAVRDHLAGAGP